MGRVDFTEQELKKAVIIYVDAWENATLDIDQDHVFSERFNRRKKEILERSRRIESRRNMRRNTAAVFLVLILSFSIVMVFSQRAQAAVWNWLVEIYDKLVVYDVNNSDGQRADLLCKPSELPEGFERTEEQHRSYYHAYTYRSRETNEYIKFTYRRPTEAQLKRLVKQSNDAEKILLSASREAYYIEKGNSRNLFWYNDDLGLSFSIESDLDRETLIETFSSLEYRLPRYEPTWLPEGYELSVSEGDIMEWLTVFSSPEAGSIILVNYTDLFVRQSLSISKGGDDVLFEDVTIGSLSGKYFPPTENDPLSELVWIDEDDALIYTISAELSKDELIKFGSSIKCTETEW